MILLHRGRDGVFNDRVVSVFSAEVMKPGCDRPSSGQDVILYRAGKLSPDGFRML
jgi:hypothetical protein